ncbi:MAG: ribokinase [Rhodobacteraceae bacterium]|nr:MAG: ribokinase [Paracoccaceae bacterium]
MAVWCFGSINIDHFYMLERLPAPGETLAAQSYRVELGGKGANQSVAAARAGAAVRHLGAVGADGAKALFELEASGVECHAVQRLEGATGHAVIMVDQAGENSIIIHAGANREMTLAPVLEALSDSETGDVLLVQNETAHQAEVAEGAMAKGMKVIYSAAPFDMEAVRAVLPFLSLLVMNKVEAAQLQAAIGLGLDEIPVETLVITRGSEGASWLTRGQPEIHVPAQPVDVMDTTGAGDCFTGALAAALDAGSAPEEAMRFASAAAALQVGCVGTAGAMPRRAEILALIDERR